VRKAEEIMGRKAAKAILHEERPALTWPGKERCPVTKGEEFGLVFLRSLAGPCAQVWITITKVKRGKKGEHMAEYSVRDDRPLYLRHRKGYTRSAADSLDPEAPVTDPATLTEFAASARLRSAERRSKSERLAAQQTNQLMRKLRRLQSEAAAYGVDLAPRLLPIIREAEREIAGKRAA
jgi:hypothetical protein